MRSFLRNTLFVCAALATGVAVEACIADETSLNPQPLPPEDTGEKRGDGTGGAPGGGSGFGNNPPPANAGDGDGGTGDAGGE
jgi:hypothetical protein